MENQHPLKVTAEKVLQDWAMMIIEPLEVNCESFDSNQPLYMSWIDIYSDGVLNGALSILAQERFLRVLGSNLLGAAEPSDVSEEEFLDAFKEMGNVLTGNFITEAYGDDLVFQLRNPNVTQIPFSDLERFVDRKVVYGFTADDAPVAVTFSMKDVEA